MKDKKYKDFYISYGLVKRLNTFERVIFFAIAIALTMSSLNILYNLSEKYKEDRPVVGGEIVEGFVGVPISVNPIFAESDIEKSISALLYSGLIYKDARGEYKGRIAESWEETEDGYIFTLKDGVTFHNDKPLTAEDVKTTIDYIQDVSLGSPLFDKWYGVEVEIIEEDKIKFTVPIDKRGSFLSSLTLGIIPAHIWRKVPDETKYLYKGAGVYIGSGPYVYSGVIETITGKPTSMTFKNNGNYIEGEPYIKRFTVKFYDSVSDVLRAFESGQIDSMSGISPADLPSVIDLTQRQISVVDMDTHRVFGIFFNFDDSHILSDPLIRSVLIEQIDRDKIIEQVFSGYANPIHSPYAGDRERAEKEITNENLKKVLDDIEWVVNEETGIREKNGKKLSINILIPDAEEFRRVTQVVTDQWEELSVEINSVSVPVESLIEIAKSGNFDALFYGYSVENINDLISFWHSSDKNSFPALINFGSDKMNKILEELSVAFDKDTQNKLYNEFKVEMNRKAPVVFLYSPKYLYIVDSSVRGIEKNGEAPRIISQNSERFINIHLWYTKIEKVWRFLK